MKQSEAEAKDYRKPCTLCQKPRNVLVRCQIDDSGKWHLLCPGKCWKSVSGGVIDGDKSDEHQYYCYGGMWKNKHEAVSAKKKSAPAKSVVSAHDIAEGSATAQDSVSEDHGGQTELGRDESDSS